MRTTLHHALLAALVSLLFAPPAVAQLAQLAELAKTTPEQRAEFQTEFMNRKLDLSSEQLESIKKINLAMATDAQPILEGDGSMPAYRDQYSDQDVADVLAYLRQLQNQ